MSATDNAWSIESVRITAFSKNAGGMPAEGYYEQCLQVTPERSEQRRAEGLNVDTGVVDQVRYTLNARRGRFDWLLSPEVDHNVSGLGGLEMLPALLKDVGKGLSEDGELKRLAFGVVARIRSDNKVESYKTLQKYLHKLEVDAENSSELAYKINRPRRVQFGNESVLINRLSNWQAVLIQQFVQLIQPNANAGDPPELVEATDWVRCELDINTDAERAAAFDKAMISEIFGTLVGFAVEILNEGDIG